MIAGLKRRISDINELVLSPRPQLEAEKEGLEKEDKTNAEREREQYTTPLNERIMAIGEELNTLKAKRSSIADRIVRLKG